MSFKNLYSKQKKILINNGIDFFNRSMKSWLQDNDIEE